MICKTCGKEFFQDYRKDKYYIRKDPIPKFCSQNCANTRKFTVEQNKKKGRRSHPSTRSAIGPYIEKICPICNTKFYVFLSSSRRIFCSKKCYNHPEAKKHVIHNSGGYREGSGRSKSGYYKGIYCGSTYELAYLIYQLDNRIPIERFPHQLRDSKDTYMPDFFQNGKIIEIKGYYSSQVEKQLRVAKKNGYEIILKYREDLIQEFEWCRAHYTYKNLWELYDTYKPRYKITCLVCKKEFETNKKNRKCCSQSCSRFLSPIRKRVKL